MTYAARLTWQAADPATFAADLGRRLDVDGREGGMAQGARLLNLGTAVLEVRPWLRESPADKPRAAGRLVLEPVSSGDEPPAPPAADDPRALLLIGLGWATVDLERAESELDMWLAPVEETTTAGEPERPEEPEEAGGPDGPGDPVDPHLGARVRLRGAGGLPGEWMVILEPATEGRVAGSLARDGEGPCTLYLWPAAGIDAWLAAARSRGVSIGRRGPAVGPFGRQALLAGPATGPHVIVVENRTPVSRIRRMSTIAP